MIFRIIHKKKSANQLRRTVGAPTRASGLVSKSANQQGVTLLMAILLLAAITSISFSLATVLFIEVRNSQDLLHTSSALYGANGVAEQALFNLRRHVPSPSYVSNFSNNTSLAGTPTMSSTSSPIFQDIVAAGSTFTATTNKYDFCSVSNGSNGCGYSKLILTYLPTGNTDALVAYLCQFDPNHDYSGLPCDDINNSAYWITTTNGSTDGGTTYPNGTLITPSTPIAHTTWNLNSSLQQELILFTSSSNPIYVSLQTFDSSGNPYGLPLEGKTSVDINAINSTTGRKIQVVVPNY